MIVGLSGKVVVITGAASGIGAAIARAAAASDVAALVLTDRDADGLGRIAEELNATAVAAVVADLGDPAAPGRIIAAALGRFGRVDGLVNAAGLTTRASVLDGAPEVWDQLFAVNARAAFFLMQGAIADMTARRSHGAVVNILSMIAHCGTPELAIYAATKGALQTLTRNAANAHMRDGIRVNGINLGWTATESEHRMQAELLGHGPGWMAAATAGLPLGRLLEPDEVARLAVFLLSDASVPMSGSVIDLEQWVVGAPPSGTGGKT